MANRARARRGEVDEDYVPTGARHTSRPRYASGAGAAAARPVRRAAAAAPARAAAPAPAGLRYAIQVSRSSRVVQYDDDIYIDCYGSELEEAEACVDTEATSMDGTWMFAAGADGRAAGSPPQQTQQQAQVQQVQPSTTLFASVQGANKWAEHVFKRMLHRPTHHFRRVPAEEALADQVKAGGEGLAAFRTMAPDGCGCWQREQQFYVDPLCDEMNSRVSSTVCVKVVPAGTSA